MIFFDYEVFKYDWLVVFINTTDKKETIIHNDREALLKFHEQYSKDIWVGHNITHYDQFIHKAIILGMDPKYVNDKIIEEHLDGWWISTEFNKIPMILYDTLSSNGKGLKVLEGFMGSNIKETDVDFNIDRPLTDDELQQTIQYCRTDVEQDIEVFMRQINEFNASMELIKTFSDTLNINDISKTKAQLSAKIIGCERQNHNDEFDVFILDCIELNKYKAVKEFFLNKDNHWYKRGTVKNEFKLNIAGLEHSFGWGGVHAAREQYHLVKGDRQIWHVDVASFYPRLMIFHGLLTRNSTKPNEFRNIFNRRLELKRQGKKLEQAPLKIVINSAYGMCKDKYSQAYDPRQANLITMNGQLMLTDLIEHLESIEGFELIQSNTDGLIISIPNDDQSFDEMDDVCYEWERRCNMDLEFDEIDWIYQKDVNNYVCMFSNGEVERKGSYVKELTPLDYDLPIVNKSLVDFMVSGIPVEETISNCDDLMEFQKIVKLTGKYEHVEHNNTKYSYKCYRVFASKNNSDGRILKCRTGSNPAKFGNTPDHCFIDNGDVTNKKTPAKLDKQWYIDLARKRLEDFGIKL